MMKEGEEDGSVETIYFEGDPYNTTLTETAAQSYLAENPEAIVFAGPYGNSDVDRHVAFAASQEKTNVATFDWVSICLVC